MGPDETSVRIRTSCLRRSNRCVRVRVEVPTQLRVRRWSFNCKELLCDPTGVREFMKFCQAEFSTESLSFYLNVQEIRNCPLSQIKEKADVVYRSVALGQKKMFTTTLRVSFLVNI